MEEVISIISISQDKYVNLDCTDDYLLGWEGEFNSWPSIRHLGFNLRFVGGFASLVYIDGVADIHRGGLGIDAVNGAIISGMMDGAIATIGFAHYPGRICGTSNLSVNMFRPVLGDYIFSCASVVKKNKNMAFCESKLYDSDLNICAIATGIVGASNNKSK